MSSRVRLMLQDFRNGAAYTGKTAFRVLQDLYNNWAKDECRPKKTSHTYWKRVSDGWATLNPYKVTFFNVLGAAEVGTDYWKGPGNYTQAIEVREEPGKILPELSKGPKWQVALEMWERLTPTHSERYRLFVSRDSRKHAWRHSLCNPFYQGMGAKPKTKSKIKFGIKPNKKKNVYYGDQITTGRLRDWERDPPREPRTTQAGQTAAKPAKPRVGIWT